MIQIIPSISYVGNKVARMDLFTPEKNVTKYDETPLDLALRLEDAGIKRVHLIDLEGAKKGRVKNIDVLEAISGYTELTIEFGGGITDDDDVRIAFENGADMIHAASVATSNKDLFSSWIISYGRNKIMLSVDSLHGKAATKGWSNNTDIDCDDLIEYFHNQSIMYVKLTDIGREFGSEPSFDLFKKTLNKFPDLKLIAGGGVRSIDDIDRFQDLGVHGVLLGRSLFDEVIKLEDLKKFTY